MAATRDSMVRRASNRRLPAGLAVAVVLTALASFGPTFYLAHLEDARTPAIARLGCVAQRPVTALGRTNLFLVAAILHAWRTLSRAPAVYLRSGLAILLSGPLRMRIGATAAWHDTGVPRRLTTSQRVSVPRRAYSGTPCRPS